MKIKISLPEVRGSIKGIHKEPARIFKKVTMTVQINVGNYLTNLMKADMTHFLWREEYNVQRVGT